MNLRKTSTMQLLNCLKSRNDVMELILVLTIADFHGLMKITSYFSMHRTNLLWLMPTLQVE